MSLKVLLADDNITAQRLGSKILTDAGHEVIAVSNGAAAVKKIASEKPGLLILDVYMPGYSGLEVCEKVKNDPATAQTPVILTVTNMEPFNQADGNRVRADGVMIKPFEATDLIAVVQKFEVKSARSASAADRTVRMAAMDEFKDASYEEWKSEAPEEAEPRKIEMPAEMASSPALGFDEPMEATPQAAVVEQSPAPAPDFAVAPTPLEVSVAPSFAAPPPAMEWAPVSVSHSPDALDPDATADISAVPDELEYTSHQDVGNVQVQQAAELEVMSSSNDAFIAQDPALVTNPDELSQFTTKMGEERPEEVVIGIAMPGLTGGEPPAVEPSIEVGPATAIADALAMEPPPDLGYSPTVKLDAVVETVSSTVEDEMHHAFASGSSGAAAATAPEIQPEPPPPHPAAPTAEIPHHLVAQFAAELDQVHQEREASGQVETPVEEAPATESIMASAAEIPVSQLDEGRIAAAVNRALEKYKDGLRQELIATIVRELKG